MIGQEIAHYRIERLLGRGGMGAVYLAHDLALDRRVALKMLATELDRELRARLVRESKLSARLQHPGIATFYDAGELEGNAYIAMEFVEGVTLRERLRKGALPVEDAIALAECLLEALVHAHAAGVVHRDIKPENIILNGARSAKLLDFGLAKRVTVTPDEEATTLTRLTLEGRIMGTAGYMPPEQLRGDTLDARADIFSVGVVLYESLAGSRAFPGRNLLEVIANTASRDPAPLPASVPASLHKIVSYAMAKDPNDRYSTAGDLLSDLRRVTDGRPLADLAQSLAVLDFENVSQDPSHDWIGSGFAEALTSDLVQVEGLAVVERQRTLGATRDLAKRGGLPAAVGLGRSLAARWVVSGAFQVVGRQIRVTSYLTEVSTGRVLKTWKTDGHMEDLFRMQDIVATSVTNALGTARRSAKSDPDPKMSAYEAYSRGQRYWNRLEKGSFHRAEELFAEAAALDAEYAPAWSGLAGIHSQFFTFTTDSKELDVAAKHARRAIDLDPKFAEPRVFLAYVLWRKERIEGALKQLDEVLDLEPESHYGHYFKGTVLLSTGRAAEALPSLQRAAEFRRGLGSLCWSMLGWAHVELENKAEALWCLEQAQSTTPAEDLLGAVLLGECLRRFGRVREARVQLDRGLKMLEGSDHMYRDTVRGICLCSLGRATLEVGDRRAAGAAFEQAIAHVCGRDRALGVGHAMVQALAGLARSGGGQQPLQEAQALFHSRTRFNFSYMPTMSDDVTRLELAQAVFTLGQVE